MSDDQKPLLPPEYAYGPPPPPQTGISPPAYGYQAGAPYQAVPGAHYAYEAHNQQPVIVDHSDMNFGTIPVIVCCSHCQKDVVTKVSYKVGTLACLSMFVMFLLGFLLHLFWCVCWIPLVMTDLKDIVHTCPNCGHVCGRKKRKF